MKLYQKTGIFLLALLCVMGLFSMESQAAGNRTRIHFISLNGNTDAILLESNGHFAMIDSGEDSDYPDGKNSKYPFRAGTVTTAGYEDQVIAYLKKVGVKKLDFYLGTHAHSDHIGSGDEVLKAFKTKSLYLRKYSDNNISDKRRLWDTQYCYDNLIAMAKKRGTRIVQNFDKASNRTFTLGDMQIELLNTKIRTTSKGKIVKQYDDNNNSLGVKITIYGKTVFLGGDMNNAKPEYDEKTVAKQVGHVDLMKLNHHGYAGSNSTKFIHTLSPDYAVVTGNLSNLSSSLTSQLNSLGTQLYTTMGQAKGTAVVASFSRKNGITMSSPGNLTVKKKKSTIAFYTQSGKRYTKTAGWFYYNQNWYYLTSKGYCKRSSWLKHKNRWYYFNSSGQMVTNATRIGNKAYSFAANGKMSSGGWTKGSTSRSYASADGRALTGLAKIKGYYYYFDNAGIMQTGFVTHKKQTYFFNNKGRMVSGSKTIQGKRYYFSTAKKTLGQMQTGFVTLKNQTYYFDKKNQGAMTIGWLHLNGKHYYMQKGVMVTNKTLTIRGISYRFDRNGVCTNYKSSTPVVPETNTTESPVTETPVTESPVTETPVTETPVTEPTTETPVTEPTTETPVEETS